MKKHGFEYVWKKLDSLTPERVRVARIFKSNIENAIYELGPSYKVDLQGKFESTPIRITIEVSPVDP